MGFNFPNNPVFGQTFQGYTWDGEKWLAPVSGGGLDPSTGDVRYVNVTGDTMTGDLTVNKATPAINLDRPDGSTPTGIFGKNNGSIR
jgi:hypothetical protein